MSNKFGPWYAVQPEHAHGWWVVAKDLEGNETVDASGDGGFEEDAAKFIATGPELLEALEAYVKAQAMPIYGDYDAINWASSQGPLNPAFGGGDCTKHGRWYSYCHCCLRDWENLRKDADFDAVQARNDALREADKKARAAIAKAKGEV